MPSHCIELRGLEYRFGPTAAVAGLDLEVGEGDAFGFLGLNGAGKTTTLRLALGLLRPRSGSVRVLGRDLRREPAGLRRIGVLFEDFAAYPYLTAYEHLRLQASLYGLHGEELSREVGVWLERVGLSDAAGKKVCEFSLGMTRRLGIACAFVHAPDVVFLDEPTNGLDPQGIHDLRGLIQELRTERGTTFFISSHILGEVEKVCDRVGIIHRGRLLVEGDVEALTASAEAACRLRVSDGEATTSLLSGEEWCGTVRLVDSSSQTGATLELGVGEADVPRLVRVVSAAGIDILEVRPLFKSLEDIFRETIAAAEHKRRAS